MGETELQEKMLLWEGSGKCREARGRDHLLHFWFDLRLEALKISQVGPGCVSIYQKSAATSGTGIREDFGKEPKLLSNETADILAKNVKTTIFFSLVETYLF